MVECSNEQLRKRVESVLYMALSTVTSLAEAYESDAPKLEAERAEKLAALEQMERSKVEHTSTDIEVGKDVETDDAGSEAPDIAA